ncbi:MAG: 16S rRNA (guanine(527)-N(7))-methyltransferase RsmG [candidate division WOR-3 bacterium]
MERSEKFKKIVFLMHSLDKEMEILKEGLKELHLPVSEMVLDKFRIYLEKLYEYRGRLHLLSHKDYTRITLKHFLPSLMVLPYLNQPQNGCDIGAGAGFPSIPVKILRPEINFVLFESVRKKAKFLQELITSLSLKGIEVVAQRAEKYKEKKFDLILIRAAGRIRDLLNTVDGLLAPTGRAFFYKKAQIDEEIKQAEARLRKKNFRIKVEKVLTPVERIPLSLVMLYRQCSP